MALESSESEHSRANRLGNKMNVDTATLIAALLSDRRSYACVSKAWYASFDAADKIWRGSLAGDFETCERKAIIMRPSGLELVPCDTYKDAWLSWRRWEREFEAEGEPRFIRPRIWMRAISMWSDIRIGLSNFPLMQTCLRPSNKRVFQTVMSKPVMLGMLQNDMDGLECLRAIWGIHDGQNLQADPLLGRCLFYDSSRALQLLPFSYIARSKSRLYLISDSIGQEFICYQDERILIVSEGVLSIAFQSARMRNTIMELFEWFANDLKQNSRSMLEDQHMSSFPIRGPRTSEAITQGIRVRGSYTPIPSAKVNEQILWVYEITIDYVPNSGQDRIWAGKRAMLLSRHWRLIDALKPEPTAVDGEGVIGYFPCFNEQGEYRASKRDSWQRGAFQYRSCTYASPSNDQQHSSMEGYLTFATESMDGRVSMNDLFNVRVAKLVFDLPVFGF